MERSSGDSGTAALRGPELPGQLASRFLSLRLLGEGTYGSVVLARDRELGRLVAIKLLLDVGGADPASRERFLREGKILAKLSSSHVTEVFDHGEIDGRPYMVTRYVDGPPLAAFLRSHGGRIPWATAASIFRDLLEGVAAAHREGIVHRDLKPANVLLTIEGRAVVADFGLGRDWDSRTVTAQGRMVGSPLYMPAQQMQGERTEPSWDVFAAGLIFAEMLTGEIPGGGRNIQEIYRARLVDLVPRLREQVPELPVELEQLAWSALAFDPGRRPPTAVQFLTAFDSGLLASGTDRSLAEDQVRSVVTEFARDWQGTAILPAVASRPPESPESPAGPRLSPAVLFFLLAVLAGLAGGRLRTAGPEAAPSPPPAMDRGVIWAQQLQQLRRRVEEDPALAQVFRFNGRGPREQAREQWQRGRARFRELVDRAGLRSLAAEIGAAGTLDPGWYTPASWLRLYQELLECPDDSERLPLFATAADPGLEQLLARGRQVRLMPEISRPRDQSLVEQAVDAWLAADEGEYRPLRSRQDCKRWDPGGAVANYNVKILSPVGKPFSDPTAKVPAFLLDDFYGKKRRERVNVAPTEFEVSLEVGRGPVYLVTAIRNWSTTKPVMLEIGEGREALAIQLSVPPGAPEVRERGTHYHGLCLRIAPGLLAPGTHRLRGTFRALPSFGTFYLTMALAECFQHMAGPPPGPFRP